MYTSIFFGYRMIIQNKHYKILDNINKIIFSFALETDNTVLVIFFTEKF